MRKQINNDSEAAAGRKLPKVSAQFHRWLLFVTLVMFLITSFFSILIQYRISVIETERLLMIAVNDEITSLSDWMHKSHDMRLSVLKESIDRGIEKDFTKGKFTKEEAANLISNYGFDEINVIDGNGIIIKSTDNSLIGFDLNSNDESKFFFNCLKEDGEVHLPRRDSVVFPFKRFMYSGIALSDDMYLQVGTSVDRLDRTVKIVLNDYTRNRHVLEKGILIVVDKDGKIESESSSKNIRRISSLSEYYELEGESKTISSITIDGESCYQLYDSLNSYRIAAILPKSEVIDRLIISVIMTVVIGFILFGTLYLCISLLVKRKVVRPVNDIAVTLERISDGDLDALVSVHSSREFSVISNDINVTVNSLKEHIAREAARIDEELTYAKNIQLSALPSLTDQFTNNRCFGLFASMDTAREVGGDFYDFYMINDHTLAITIADVSGKGIPAAMFMMRGKAILNDYFSRPGDPGNNISRANRRICIGNDAGMFITAWMGMLDIITGQISYVNAGHNPPVLIHDGKADYLDMKKDLILGLMDDENYTTQSLKLDKGDILYLYTDGVTEAVSTERRFFGEKRLLEILDGMALQEENVCKAVCSEVTAGVESFSYGASKADDMTMLCIRFNGIPDEQA